MTASGAQEFTESFVAAGSGLDDLDVDYAWTTAASVDPWPEGVNFFPRMFDDVAAEPSPRAAGAARKQAMAK